MLRTGFAQFAKRWSTDKLRHIKLIKLTYYKLCMNPDLWDPEKGAYLNAEKIAEVHRRSNVFSGRSC